MFNGISLIEEVSATLSIAISTVILVAIALIRLQQLGTLLISMLPVDLWAVPEGLFPLRILLYLD